MSWQKGVVFIRGLNMYKFRRIRKSEILQLCRSIEDPHVKILKIFKTDNIIFEKRKVHYATVAKRLERAFSRQFGISVYATARSLRTVEGVVQRAK